MKTILTFLGVLVLTSVSSAHPSGDASVLDHNIVAIKLKMPVNIPPKASYGIIVRNGESTCWMVPQPVEGFDRSVTPKTDGKGKFIPMTLPLLKKPRYVSNDVLGEGNSAIAAGAPYVISDPYVEFELASQNDPTQPNPNIKSINCGFSKNGLELIQETTLIGRALYRRREIPSMEQLNGFAGKALEFVPGETVELSGQ